MSAWLCWLWLGMAAMGVVISVSEHGEDRGTHNGPGYFILILLMFGIYYWGGFFAPLGWGS